MARMTELHRDDLTDAQKRVWDDMVAGPRGTAPPPHQVWLTNPAFCDPAQRLGAYCRYGSNLPTALSELAILVVAHTFRANYEWWAHSRIARDGGLPDPIIEAVRVGATPDFTDAPENAEMVWRVARTLMIDKRLSDVLFAEADSQLGRPALTDVVGICGYYCLVSLTLNVFEIPTPDGSQAFADLPA
ncbi:MAG: carboxymuconolactone decarboxylase family protein [Pseudomonadota bacterium]